MTNENAEQINIKFGNKAHVHAHTHTHKCTA